MNRAATGQVPHEPRAPRVPHAVARLTDGEWHRLHWASPLLKGGFALVAVLAFVLANLRERVVELFIPVGGGPEGPGGGRGPGSGGPGGGGGRGPGDQGDIVAFIYDNGQTGLAILIVLGVILLAVAAFAVAWRMHSFRIGDDAVEVRSGVLFRHNRQARLDRIQGIHITRPLFARLFGAAKIELSVAGQDAKVELAYLGSNQVDDLRLELLRRASGVQRAETTALLGGPEVVAAGPDGAAGSGAPAGAGGAAWSGAPAGLDGPAGSGAPDGADGSGAPAGAGGSAGAGAGATGGSAGAAATGGSGAAPGLVERRLNELLAPELDPGYAPPESVVRISPLRLVGSLVVSEFTVVLLLVVAALFVTTAVLHQFFFLFLLLPSVIGSLGYYTRRFTKSVRYSIAATPDGVRVGFGLLTTSNDTLPPGRIHAIEVTQPILWRPMGWWMIRINRAGHASSRGAAGQAHTLLLPVGRAADVERVLGLLLSGLAAAPAEDPSGAQPAGAQTQRLVAAGLGSRRGAGFGGAPARAFWLRPLSWRRTGYAATPDAVLLRTGFVWRRLYIVPLARMQSIHISQGPVRRLLNLAELHFTTIPGPVRATLGVIDRRAALAAFSALSDAAIAAAAADPSHRWAERPTPPAPATPLAPAQSAAGDGAAHPEHPETGA